MSSDDKGAGNVVKLTTLARAARREEKALVIDEAEHQLDVEEMIKWIVDRADPNNKRRQCCVFFLSHIQRGKGPVPVTPVPTIAKNASAEERARIAREIALDFSCESSNIAATEPDLQRFIVSAFSKEGNTDEDMGEDPEFTRSFLVSPPPDVAANFFQNGRGPGGAGEVDPSAVLGHVQRLAETLAKQNSQNLQAMQDRLVSWNTDVMKLNQIMQEKSFQQTLEMEKLADDRAMRDANAVERKMHIDAQYQLFQGLMTYGKAAAEKYLAAKGGAGKAEGELGPMLAFMKTLEPAQILIIIETLSPAQQEMFWPMASMLVSSMPSEKQQMLGALLHAHQEKLVAKAEDIRITVQKKEGES
jgi:hypothetical protein